MFRRFWFIVITAFLLVSCSNNDIVDISIISAPTDRSHTRSTSTPKITEDGIQTTVTPDTVIGFTPTATQDLTFRYGNINTVPPEDVVKEIAYFGGFGGGGTPCVSETYQVPTIWGSDFDADSITKREIFVPLYIDVCGIPIGEAVQVIVEIPDGSSRSYRLVSEQVETQNKGKILFTFIPELGDPVGLYRILFQGDGWSLERDVEVLDPPSARLYLVDRKKLIFYKFYPSEHVRLLAYEFVSQAVFSGLTLVGWKNYQVDDNGILIIQVDLGEMYMAIGDISGQVYHSGPGETYRWAGYTTGDVYCSNAPTPIGLRAGSYAFVVVDALPVYGKDDILIGRLKRGETAYLYTNPQCEDNVWWWGAECIGMSCSVDGGKIQEGDEHTAYLHPLNESFSDDAGEIPFCPEPLPTRLHVGMRAQVTTSGMAPQLSLRYGPEMGASKAHVIAAGREMTILAGPLCVDGSYWWYVRSEQGFEGWAREGDYEDYWIDPLP